MQDNMIYVLLNPYNNVEGVFIDEIQAKNYLVFNYCRDYRIIGVNSNIKQVIKAQQYLIERLKKELKTNKIKIEDCEVIPND